MPPATQPDPLPNAHPLLPVPADDSDAQDPDVDSESLWDEACSGGHDRVYRLLRDRVWRGGAPESVYLRLYWLRVAFPEVDLDVKPIDWPVRAIAAGFEHDVAQIGLRQPEVGGGHGHRVVDVDAREDAVLHRGFLSFPAPARCGASSRSETACCRIDHRLDVSQ